MAITDSARGWSPARAASVPAVRAVWLEVAAAGLQLVDPQPIVLPEGETGDAINHVRPDLRAAYTEKIYREIAPLLK